MGIAHQPQRVKLFAGLIARDEALLASTGRLLERTLRNPIDFESDVLDFFHTTYYADEFGTNLKRRFVSFKKTVALDGIHRAKIRSNALEHTLSRNGRRRINIDPGYLDLAKVVLFSTKDFSHRIYLAQGIFSEITLTYRAATFRPLPWTYPDYQSTAYIDLFNDMRTRYKDECTRGRP